MGLIGLMNVLQIEGEKNDIRVNALGPGAATRMTEALLPKPVLGLMTPEAVTPAALYLVSDDAPRRTILNATAGGFARTLVHETEGVYLHDNERTPERIAELFGQISDEAGQHLYRDGGGQVMKFITKAAKAHGVALG